MATAFCSIHVERQPYGLLVTTTLSPDLTERSADRVVRSTRLADALALAAEFLTDWVEAPDPGPDRP